MRSALAGRTLHPHTRVHTPMSALDSLLLMKVSDLRQVMKGAVRELARAPARLVAPAKLIMYRRESRSILQFSGLNELSFKMGDSDRD
jgi:hypothetical protein